MAPPFTGSRQRLYIGTALPFPPCCIVGKLNLPHFISCLFGLSEVLLQYLIFLILGMNIACNFSNEGLSQGFIYNAAIRDGLGVSCTYSFFFYFLYFAGVERCSLGFML